MRSRRSSRRCRRCRSRRRHARRASVRLEMAGTGQIGRDRARPCPATVHAGNAATVPAVRPWCKSGAWSEPRRGGRPRAHQRGALRGRRCLAAVRRLTSRAPAPGCCRPARRTALAFDPKSLDELARKLADAVPPGLAALRERPRAELHAPCCKAASPGSTSSPRQEFDIQAAGPAAQPRAARGARAAHRSPRNSAPQK